MSSLRRLLCVLMVLNLSGLAVLPVHAQSRTIERTEMRRLPAQLQQAITRALRREGIEISGNVTAYLSAEDCPGSCNDATMDGRCLCTVDPRTGRCPDGSGPAVELGFPPTPDNVPGGQNCAALPDYGRLEGSGIPDSRFRLR